MWIVRDRYDQYDVELARMLTEYRLENKMLNQRIADLERLLSLAEKMCDTLKEQKEKSNTEEQENDKKMVYLHRRGSKTLR